MSEELAKTQYQHGGTASITGRQSFLPRLPLPDGLVSGAVGIADMANAFGVTHRTLHFYEEKGLIRADRAGIMRVYNDEQISRMSVINACRETGMPVAVLQELMTSLDTADSQEEADALFSAFLAARRRELQAEQSNIMRQLTQLCSLIDGVGPTEDRETNDNTSAQDFTRQEMHCLSLIAEGYSKARLAQALGLSSEDADALETAVIAKLGSNNRFQAVAKAILLGIVAS